MATERFTPLGGGLWKWKPWTNLERNEPKLLWLALYTSDTAKRCVPGLWTGSLYGMSDDSGLSLNTTHNALDDLVKAKLVQFDQENRLVRLLQLPDALDRAHNDKALSSWWTRFLAIPNVPIRDAHVALLWWMVQSGTCSDNMVKMWGKTFGTIRIPAHIAPFQPLRSSDTSTVVQPSLFSAASFSGSKEINNSGPPCDHQPSTPGGPDPDPDLDLVLPDPERGGRGESAVARPHLQLVPSATPAEVAQQARAQYATDMFDAVREAGGESMGLLRGKETT